jgi:O-antigen ligase
MTGILGSLACLVVLCAGAMLLTPHPTMGLVVIATAFLLQVLVNSRSS